MTPRPTRTTTAQRIPTWLVAIALVATACMGTTATAPPTDPPVTAPPTAGPTASPAPSLAASPSPAGIELAKANVPRAAATIDDARQAAAAVNAFGFELHRALAAGGTNLVASPTSVAIALGMARIGARGATAAEMDAVLSDLATDEHAARSIRGRASGPAVASRRCWARVT